MKKQLKLIVCLMLCTSILLSACLIEHNTEHNCIGENCQICRDIALQRELLKSIFLCLLCDSIFICVSHNTVIMSLFADKEKRKLSLVANKVKLTA